MGVLKLFKSVLFGGILGFSLLGFSSAGEVSFKQAQAKPSAPQAAPQISGRLIGNDGELRVILEYTEKNAHGTFIGDLHAACVIPARTAAIPTPIALSQIPKGSLLTLFYVRRAIATKKGRKIEHVIMAIRFDEGSKGLGIPKGETLSCYNASTQSKSK